jgi:glyoxylase-like metal-dependent hydrolase (beta-lactamase superfamily II)
MSSPLKIECYALGPFIENCYVLVGPSGSKAAIVDPGLDSEPLLELFQERGLELEWIINTHGHLDHVAGNSYFKKNTAAKLIIHPGDREFLSRVRSQAAMFGMEAEDSPPPDADFEEGTPFIFDGAEFEVIHTPGHSPGGVCLRFDNRLLVGDTLFKGSIGRSDLPGGSHRVLVESIRGKLFSLPGETICLPGHGPETTLADERLNNPFVSDRVAGIYSQENQ